MRILLVDGNNYAYRGMYAIKDLSSNDGIPTNAVRGFFTILSTDIKVLRPTHVALSFDRTPSFRRLEMYPEYKGTRDHSGVNIDPQLRIIRKLTRASGLATLDVIGEESDDIIATLAVLFGELDFEVLISSTDKDFAALVGKKTKIVEPRTRSLIGQKGVMAKFGVRPNQMQDLLTLMGDKADNVPGAKGVAKKTAAKLLSKYGSIKGIYGAVKRNELTPALTRNLVEFRSSGQLELSYKLIKLFTEVKVNSDPSRFDLSTKRVDANLVRRMCEELNLTDTHKLIRGMNK